MLGQFWAYFNSVPTFCGIKDLLIAEFPNAETFANAILSGQGGDAPSSEGEAAALGYWVLSKLSSEPEFESTAFVLARSFGGMSDLSGAVDVVRDALLEPFYEYVDEHLDDHRAMLALLLRYKHRSEWFHRSYLLALSAEGELVLAQELYSYLYDQGIDFTIEPSSPKGAIDLISTQGTKDPLLVDIKIFDGVSRSKAYICKGFNQIYTYTQQYNEPIGYLVIFNISDVGLQFQLSATSSDIPIVVINHKTIFLLQIDIHEYAQAVSARGVLRSISISDDDLIKNIETTTSVLP
jgi:hypothetical protein